MSIKIKREHLERIVTEELTRFLAQQLSEAQGDESDRSTVLDDEVPEEDPLAVPEDGEAPDDQATPGDESDVPELSDMGMETPDLEAGEDDADVDLDALAAGEEPPSEEEEGTVAGEINGKTIKDVTVNEESEVMPGATEVVFTFKENPDALRLLITKTGRVKYFYRGLHNTLGSSVSPVADDDAPENAEDLDGAEGLPPEGEDMGAPEGEELEDMSPLGDEDLPQEDKIEDPTSSRR